MNEAFEIITKINWFLKPVTEFILFLFTTKAGFTVLVVSLIAYLLLPIFDEFRARRLAIRAASSYGGTRLSILEKLYIIGKVIFSRLGKIVSKGPVLLISLLLMMFIVTISTGITTIDTFVKNKNKIEELQTAFKQLDKDYEIAEIEILNYDYMKNETTLEIKYLDASINDFSDKAQEIIILGNDIYFDQIVINFDYSQIAEGQSRNLVLPYRIFSNSVPASEGIKLHYKDENEVPLIYKRSDDEIYILTKEQYDNSLKEFVSYFSDDKIARTAGVRSSIGNAVHKKVKKGDKLVILVRQSGGLVLKPKTKF